MQWMTATGNKYLRFNHSYHKSELSVQSISFICVNIIQTPDKRTVYIARLRRKRLRRKNKVLRCFYSAANCCVAFNPSLSAELSLRCCLQFCKFASFFNIPAASIAVTSALHTPYNGDFFKISVKNISLQQTGFVVTPSVRHNLASRFHHLLCREIIS